MTNLEPTLEIIVVQATHLNINIGFSRRILNYSMTKSCTCVKIEVEKCVNFSLGSSPQGRETSHGITDQT